MYNDKQAVPLNMLARALTVCDPLYWQMLQMLCSTCNTKAATEPYSTMASLTSDSTTVPISNFAMLPF